MLNEHLKQYTARGYSALVECVNESHTVRVTAHTGAVYSVEVHVAWDATPGGDIRVLGSIDDGGWRAVLPLTDSVLIEP